MQVIVQRIDRLAADVLSYDLVSTDGGPLPPFSPGAHVELLLANGLTRQYSLCNSPRDLARYRIAVKREERSRGGSAYLHEQVKHGSRLSIVGPRNRFPLNDDAESHLLLAGGIGVTPMISMSADLLARGVRFQLEYFVRSSSHEAFGEELRSSAFRNRVRILLGMSPAETVIHLQQRLRDRPAGANVYVCGPDAFMKAALNAAAHWPAGSVHFEAFGSSPPIPVCVDQPFEVVLARSNRRIPVPGNKSIVEALHDAGETLDVSCLQGVCGVCALGVIEGSPDHRDAFLSDAEKAAGAKIMPCVSRSKAACLVLDL